MEILSQIADNPQLTEALKAVLLKQFSLDQLDNELDNERLGQIVRARLDGVLLVEMALREIAKHKTAVTIPKEDNPAR